MSTSLLFLLSDGKLQMKNYLKLPRIHSEKKNHYQNNLEKTGLKWILAILQYQREGYWKGKVCTKFQEKRKKLSYIKTGKF